MRNTFQINADLKKKTYIPEPIVTQNDDITFIVSVFDNGSPVSLAGVTTASLANARMDGITVVTPGTIISDNIIQFDLGTNETAIPGKVLATVQLYDEDERVSTIAFTYRVAKDPTGSGYVPTENEQTLIEIVLNNGPLVIQQAQDAASYAQEQGDYAKQVADENKTRLLTPVATFADIATTYPNPQFGDTVQTLDDGKFYRYEGGQWNFKEQYTSTAINSIVNELSKQNKQSVTIGHGLNIINASQNSPLDVRIEGRTLVNVSQNVLDPAKYYVLADKKSKVKFSDGTTYTGVAKFVGRAEKPILIRIENFEGKVSGSMLENPHVAKLAQTQTTLQSPTGTWSENSQTDYNNISKNDGVNAVATSIVNGGIAQRLFSFNLIEAIERNIGKIPASDTAGKVAWLKANITKLTCNWWGYGSSPIGNKATSAVWNGTNSTWANPWLSHSNGTVTKLAIVATPTNYLDNNGFFHVLVYADPSDGVTASTIYTDYVELEIELNQNAQLWNPRCPLYEVDATTEYPNILTTWDENEVMRRYPMVESVQHVQNPYVIAEGENLLPPFTEWNSIHSNATIKAPYELELNATATGQYNYVDLKVKPNTTYTLSITHNGKMAVYKLTDSFIQNGALVAYTSNQTATFTVDSATNFIRVFVSNDLIPTGKFTFTNPMLTVGNQPKPFVPRNPSMLFAEVKLGAIGDKKDILWKDGQDWKVTKWIEKDVVLDGKLNWLFAGDYTGYKRVNYTGLSGTVSTDSNNTFVLTKYDGKKIAYYTADGSSFNNADEAYCYNNVVSITISDTDSGWGENYTPTTQEIQAYFYGWRMCNGTYGQPYDGTGTKTWYPIGDTDLSRAVTTCPTSAAPTISEGKIGYYKLSYVRSTPVTEVVTDKVEGDLVVNGATQVEVGSGVIVREKANPQLSSGVYYINADLITASRLKNKAAKIFALYKGNVLETKWKYGSSGGYGIPNTSQIQIAQTDFDTTADYYVTYLIYDRVPFTTNILAVTATYDSSLKSVVDSVVAKQSDLASNQQALIRSVAELYKRIKALGG